MLGILGVTGLLGMPRLLEGGAKGEGVPGVPKMQDLLSVLEVPGVLGLPRLLGMEKVLGMLGVSGVQGCWVPWAPRGVRHTSSPIPLLAVPAGALLSGAVQTPAWGHGL